MNKTKKIYNLNMLLQQIHICIFFYYVSKKLKKNSVTFQIYNKSTYLRN